MLLIVSALGFSGVMFFVVCFLFVLVLLCFWFLFALFCVVTGL